MQERLMLVQSVSIGPQSESVEYDRVEVTCKSCNYLFQLSVNAIVYHMFFQIKRQIILGLGGLIVETDAENNRHSELGSFFVMGGQTLLGLVLSIFLGVVHNLCMSSIFGHPAPSRRLHNM